MEKYGRSTEEAKGVKGDEDLTLKAEGDLKDEEVIGSQDANLPSDNGSVSSRKSGTTRVSVQGGSARSPARSIAGARVR